jgi:hypothetical protein
MLDRPLRWKQNGQSQVQGRITDSQPQLFGIPGVDTLASAFYAFAGALRRISCIIRWR